MRAFLSSSPSTLLWVLLAAGAASAEGGAGFPANQPFSSFWFPNDLLSWTPASDPDADFNRGGVPLADRFTSAATQVNAHAHDGEAEVVALSVMYPSTSNNPSQGAASFDIYAFNYWQYVDLLVMWGGSAGEGLILTPSADVIDAAHRNGVPVLGTIFFPPTAFGGDIQWVQDCVQQNGSIFPVADKLIEVADYYGFDGWFLNQETAGGDQALAQQMQDFLVYFQENKSPGMHMMWYDAMTRLGLIQWQNELNNQNKMFLQVNADTTRVSDSMFLNFNWGGTGNLDNSRTKALNLGRDPYEVFAGINVGGNGYNVNADWDTLFPEGQIHTVSLGFFGPEWTYASSTDNADFYQRGNRFWVGQNRDPSNTTTGDDWKGVAHYVPASSPLNELPFVTNFNTGHGHLYAIDGEVLKVGDWNNRSLQDVLPTWRWIAESGAQALYPELDWDDAYYGGTCLKVSGDLDASNTTHLRLFKASLPLTGATNLSIAYKTGAGGAASHMEVGVAFEDDPATFEFFSVDSTTSADWNVQTIGLGAHSGRTIAVISLRFASPAPVGGYEMKVGRIAVVEGGADIPAAPTNVAVTDFLMSDSRTGSIRLRWDASVDPVYYYNVYRVNPDLSRTYLGGTPNDAYFVSRIDRVGAETTSVIEIEAAGPEFGHSAAGTTSVFWGLDPPNDPPIVRANGPYCGLTGAPLAFDSNGTLDPDGSIAGYQWSFGDGDSSAQANPTHAYSTPGNYPVVLTIVDDLGAAAADTTLAIVSDTPLEPTPGAAWYQLDDASGSSAADSSGNGNDGSVVGATWTAGVIGGALDFDGSGDYVLVSDYPKPESTMTVAVWAYARSRPGWASIAKNWAGSSGAFHLGLHSGAGDLEVQVAEGDDDVVALRECVEFPLDEWQHVAVVADGSEIRLYRNAVEIASAPYDGTLKTTRPALGIGMKPNDAGTGPDGAVPGYWDGWIDDVRIHARTLCYNELFALYAQGALTGVDGNFEPHASADFSLDRNAPNPFNPSTRIRFRIPAAAHVSLAVFDAGGRRVAELVDGVLAAGTHSADWNGRDSAGRDVASGIYFYRLRAGDRLAVRKMSLLR